MTAEEVNKVISTKPTDKVEKNEGKPEEKKKRGRKPVFKPTQFDLDLLHLLREGTGQITELRAHLGVSESELTERLKLLKQENLATEENGVFHLTVTGYNFYTAKGVKKVSLRRSFTGEVKLQKPRKPAEKRVEQTPVPAQKHVNDFLSSTEVVDLGGKLGRMDLEEIIRRYGPSPQQKEQFIQRKVEEKTQGAVQTPPMTKPVVQQPSVISPPTSFSDSVEVCDLCKSDFKLAVSNPELAKYGHCFCGAAYHKECYDSLLADSAKCIRCGKKLFLIIDKQSRDAINKIKDIFE